MRNFLRRPFLGRNPKHPGEIIAMLRWRLDMTAEDFSSRLVEYYPRKVDERGRPMVKRKAPLPQSINSLENGKTKLNADLLFRVADSFYGDVVEKLELGETYDDIMTGLAYRLAEVKDDKTRNKIIKLLALLVYTAE